MSEETESTQMESENNEDNPKQVWESELIQLTSHIA